MADTNGIQQAPVATDKHNGIEDARDLQHAAGYLAGATEETKKSNNSFVG